MQAIYAGSFDPLTYGHIDVINQTIKMFGNCNVVLGKNPSKTPLFTEWERYNSLALFRSINGLSSKMDILVHNGLTVDAYPYAASKTVLVRGVRNMTDMIAEMALADVNEEISGIKTVFIPTSNQYRNYSSSIVKELWSNGKSVAKYCPAWVVDALKGKK